MRIEILDEAERDLVDASEFYERQSPGLGAYFLESLFADIESLYLYAGVHAQYFGYHRLLAKTFPFAIYYRADEHAIRIYAVLDCRRNPARIRRRLR